MYFEISNQCHKADWGPMSFSLTLMLGQNHSISHNQNQRSKSMVLVSDQHFFLFTMMSECVVLPLDKTPPLPTEACIAANYALCSDTQHCHNTRHTTKKQQPPCYSLHHMRIWPTKGQPWNVGSRAVLSTKDLGVSWKDKTLRDKTTGFFFRTLSTT